VSAPRFTAQIDCPWMRIGAGELMIAITVRPSSARSGILRSASDGLVVGVGSAPDKGKANEELIDFFADELKLPRSAVMIVRGLTSRKKTVRVITHLVEQTAERLRKMSQTAKPPSKPASQAN
jgi:uncharacterized protein (TIGR00251 family)